MNILIIGNGFDLAHGLPTKYTDFLDWIIDQTYFYEYLKEEESEIVKNIPSLSVNIPKAKRRKNLSKRVPHQQEIWYCIDDNFWIDYFLHNPMYQKENWIDFESEISCVIKSLDDDMIAPEGKHLELEDKIQCITNDLLKYKYISWFEKKTYKDLRDILSNDLYRLIRVLEIYL